MLRQDLDPGSPQDNHTDISGAVAAFIADHFDGHADPSVRLGRWTRQSIAVENQAKLTKILASANPAEACRRVSDPGN